VDEGELGEELEGSHEEKALAPPSCSGSTVELEASALNE
jgi:hypothetical protein